MNREFLRGNIGAGLGDTERQGTKAAASGIRATGRPGTIVYIHGIANKPPASVLKCQWDRALFGRDIGERSRVAYWVNRNRYPVPLRDTCSGGDTITSAAVDDRFQTQSMQSGTSLQSHLERIAAGAEERQLLSAIAARMSTAGEQADDTVTRQDVRKTALPLPPGARRWLTRQLTEAFLDDVNDFLFDAGQREAMEQSLRARLLVGGGPFIVIAHSQGSMIAYNVLRQLSTADCDVQHLITIGSPLGIQEVQDVLRSWDAGRLRWPPCVQRWTNLADRLDIVAADPWLANDYQSDAGRIEDVVRWGLNKDSPWSPHSATGYLKVEQLRHVVAAEFGDGFGEELQPFQVAKDVVNAAEDDPGERHPVLLHLTDQDHLPDGEDRQALRQALRDIVAPSELEAAEIDELRRFIAAKLTRREIEELASRFESLPIQRVWRDLEKHTLIWRSVHTVQAKPALLGYEANGRDIHWAVLDTGIRSEHPQFYQHQNIFRQWDCTRSGPPRDRAIDGDGHGTHVAGIIAGQMDKPLDSRHGPTPMHGVAPQTKLHVYKVLRDDGTGRDSFIIKALDHISALNESSEHLAVHGLNLSLGGDFDPTVYGCGHSPVCQELRRLWRQGVLVCIAAGNEGLAMLESASGTVQSNQDLSISDPGNLDEAITVGSTHRTRPHTYGVSYFSSRGPTADGRQKPDLVAPGERILSARSRFAAGAQRLEELYVEQSGTSMAAPHVSGILAAFLSVRREFIGEPDRVKRILLDNCTDLGRDPYIQGRGMPNLINMLVNS